jgi:putative Mg2+ transporter-C (MgtC) family protein
MALITIGRGELLGRLALAIVLGSLIGFERERRERSAGMRTHALVCLGSTLFMLVSAYGVAAVASGTPLSTQNALRSIDPFRIAAQVVSGIGFLGAGLIFFRREIVRGLTTAAGLWVVAALGLAVGAGMYVASIGAAAACLIVLAGFRPIERRLFRRPQRLIINVRPETGQLAAIREVFAGARFQLHRLTLLAGEKAKQEMIRAEYSFTPESDIEQLIDGLRRVPGFLSIDQVILHLDGNANTSVDTFETEETAADEGAEEQSSLFGRLRLR